MIMLVSVALASVNLGQTLQVPPPAPPPVVPLAPADPARLAAAQRLLTAMRIEEQYETILSKLIPLMTMQIFGNLKDNVNVPTELRGYLSDPANNAKAVRIFADEAGKSFRTKYPTMRASTATEYARLFEAAELDQLTTFYQTPVGQKSLRIIPELQEKIMPVGMTAGREAGVAALQATLRALDLDRNPEPKS